MLRARIVLFALFALVAGCASSQEARVAFHNAEAAHATAMGKVAQDVLEKSETEIFSINGWSCREITKGNKICIPNISVNNPLAAEANARLVADLAKETKPREATDPTTERIKAVGTTLVGLSNSPLAVLGGGALLVKYASGDMINSHNGDDINQSAVGNKVREGSLANTVDARNNPVNSHNPVNNENYNPALSEGDYNFIPDNSVSKPTTVNSDGLL